LASVVHPDVIRQKRFSSRFEAELVRFSVCAGSLAVNNSRRKLQIKKGAVLFEKSERK
jgi:hypothetical protein